MVRVLADTEGLWPGVYAIAADADIYCLPCARRIYGKRAVKYVINPPWGGNELDPAWPRDREGNPLAAILASEEAIDNVHCGATDHEEATGFDSLLALGSGHVDADNGPIVSLTEADDGTLSDAEGAAFYRYDMGGCLDNLYGETCERCHCGLDQRAYICLDGGAAYCDDCVTVE